MVFTKRPGRSFCWWLVWLLSLKILLTSASYPLGKLAVGLGWSLLLLPEPLFIAGHFASGNFTSQIQGAFQEPCLLVVIDPRTDHYLLTELSYVNFPAIMLCQTLHFANMSSSTTVGLMWWTLAQEVLCMCGTMWAPMREHILSLLLQNPEEIGKEAEIAAGKAVTQEEFQGECTTSAPGFTALAAQPEVGLPRWPEWSRICLPMQETQETQVWSLGWEDPLEEDMATHFRILDWEVPWTEEPAGVQSMGLQSWTQLKQLSMRVCTSWGYRPVWNRGHALCPGQTAGLSPRQGLVWNSHCSGHCMGRNDHWVVLSSSSMGSAPKKWNTVGWK